MPELPQRLRPICWRPIRGTA